MTLHSIFLIAVAVILLVVLPIYGVISFGMWLKTTPSDRPARRGGSMGGVFLPLDRLIRPSVEHQIEAQQRIVKKDADQGGE